MIITFHRDKLINTQSNIPELTKTKKHLKPGIKIFLSVILSFPFIMGLLFINEWITNYNNAMVSNNWAEATGIVKEKNISVSKSRSSAQRGGSTTTLSYRPKIIYTYTDDNNIYTYDTIDYLNKPLEIDKHIVQKILDDYPSINNEITIYISPDKKHAVIHKGASNMNYLGIILASVFALIGLIGFKKIWL
jgi:hypothetical protein